MTTPPLSRFAAILILGLVVLAGAAPAARAGGVELLQPDGVRVKVAGTTTIYLVDQGRCRPLTHAAYLRLWREFGSVRVVGAVPEELVGEMLGAGTRLVAPVGTTELWLIDNAKVKRRVTSFAAAAAWGFATERTEAVSREVLAAFPEGEPISVAAAESAPGMEPGAPTWRGVTFDTLWNRRENEGIAAFGPCAPGLLDRIETGLASDDPGARRFATRAAAVAGPPAIPLLRKAIAESEPRPDALLALAELAPDDPAVLPGLLALLEDPARAARAARLLERREDLPEAARAKLDDFHGRFRPGPRSLRPLARSEAPLAGAAAARLRDDRDRILEAAAEGEIAPAFRAALGERDWRMRVGGVNALAEAAPFPAAADALREALVDADRAVREAAVEAYAKLGAVAVPTLDRILAEGGPDARWRAARSLAKIARAGDPAAAEILEVLADDPDPVVAAVARRAGK